MTHAGSHNGTITRTGRLDSLPDLLGFVDDACRKAGLDDGATFEVHLAVEEICVNTIRHGFGDGTPGTIEIGARKGERGLEIIIADDAPTFAPTEAPPPDFESPWEERPIGGLGWHLAQSVMDEIRHEPGPDGGNRLTLIKHHPSGDDPSSP